MAISSHVISLSGRPFASPSVPRKFHVKPSLYRTTTTNGNVVPSIYISKRTSTESLNLVAKASADEAGDEIQIKPQQKSMSILDWLFSFSRPFVIRGTVIGVAGAVTRVWMENPNLVQTSNWLQLSSTACLVVIAMVLCDGFVNQTNNISDIEIDRVNKPYLPLPSGAISLNTAWAMVAGAAATSIGIAAFLKSQAFLISVLLQLVFGIIYSIPPFYAKRNTYGAVLTIATMRGFVFSFLMCAGATATLGLPFQLSPPIVFLSIFTTVYGLAIGIMKDIPDIKGDTIHKVPTLAATYGAKFAADSSLGFIFLSYMGAIAAGFLYPQMFNQSVMVSTHLAIMLWFAFQAWKLNNENYNKEASKSFYLMMWDVLSLECLIFPFI